MIPTESFSPAYLKVSNAELRERAERALASLAHCRASPRDCGVNRIEDKWAACKTGATHRSAVSSRISVKKTA